jgi:hypothetical protein
MIRSTVLTSSKSTGAGEQARGRKRAVKVKVSRKKSKRRVEKHVYYVVEILGWEWSFMFGVSNAPQISGGPYDDYRHLMVHGKLIRPTRLQERSLELNLLPDERLNKEHRQNDHPTLIGHLSFHGRPSALMSVPADALPTLLTMLIAEKFKYVVLHGSALRYRQTDLQSLRFEMQIDEEDLPDEEVLN